MTYTEDCMRKLKFNPDSKKEIAAAIELLSDIVDSICIHNPHHRFYHPYMYTECDLQEVRKALLELAEIQSSGLYIVPR